MFISVQFTALRLLKDLPINEVKSVVCNLSCERASGVAILRTLNKKDEEESVRITTSLDVCRSLLFCCCSCLTPDQIVQ